MSDPVLSPLQRLASTTAAFAVSWVLIAFVCVAVFGMTDSGAAAYAALSSVGGIFLREWWVRRG